MAEVAKEWEAFDLLAPPLAGAEAVRGLKRGRPVSAGEILARSADPARGDLPASVAGVVEAVRADEVVIRRNETAVGETPWPAVLADLSPAWLGRALKELGLDLAGPLRENPSSSAPWTPNRGWSSPGGPFWLSTGIRWPRVSRP